MRDLPPQPSTGCDGIGWCSLHLRFDESELSLLRRAEELRGRQLPALPPEQALHTGLPLMKAGRKLALAGPGTDVAFDQPELEALAQALSILAENSPQGTRPSIEQLAARLSNPLRTRSAA